MKLVGATGQTHRDNRRFGEQRILLPPLESEVCQHIVIANHYVRRGFAYCVGGAIEPDPCCCYHAHRREVACDVLAQKGMARDAQCAERIGCNLLITGCGCCLGNHAASS